MRSPLEEHRTMQPCPRVPTCPLFAQFKVKASLKVWQAFFCEGSFDRCERYKLAARGQPAPLSLLPNGRFLEVPLDQLEPAHLQ
jgi:hypothetical protein